MYLPLNFSGREEAHHHQNTKKPHTTSVLLQLRFTNGKEIKKLHGLNCLFRLFGLSFPLANGFASTSDVSTLPDVSFTGILNSPSVQQRSNHRSTSTEKQSTVNIISRPRPSSIRSRIDAWQIIPRVSKPNSKDSECLEGNVGPDVNFLPDTEERTNCHMPSLLDIDVEGQNRDCTVPLCRMKSKTCRPSIYELEREFLS